MLGRIVEISERGRYLSVHRGFMVVRSGEETVGQVPLDDIAALICNGYGLTYSNNLLEALSDRGVPVVICGRNHSPKAVIWPLDGHHRQAAHLDAQLQATKPMSKRLWQQVIRAKLGAQAHILIATGAPDAPLRTLIPRVRSGDPGNVEAQAARRYWRLLFGQEFRRQTQGGEGVNALLNYGYAVLRAAVARAVVAAGLHPSLAIHHAHPRNPFRLVDDLMEPYRPQIDFAVWNLRNRGLVDVNRDTKPKLAGVLYRDLPSVHGTSPLLTCIQRTAQSLVQVYLRQQTLLEITLPGDRNALVE